MRCFVGLLLLGLCFGVGAHNTPKIRDGSYSHTPSEDWHERVRARWPEDHWHYSERQTGAWYQCVADVYDESRDRYNLHLADCGDDGRTTEPEMIAPTPPSITPPPPREEIGDLTMTNPPGGGSSVPPTTHTEVPPDCTEPESTISSDPEPEFSRKNSGSMEVEPIEFTYNHTFPKGVSLQHVPLDIIDFNEFGVAVNSVPGVFDQLGDSVASLIASRGSSGWTYVTYPDFPAHNAIWKSVGFAAVMHEEVTVQITGTFGG